MKTTIQEQVLHLTEHAIIRYAERIKGINDSTWQERTRFGRELASLVASHGSLSSAAPDWIGLPPEDAASVRRAHSYVFLGDDICIPVEHGTSSLVGITLLARGGFSEQRRRDRNQRRQEARARRTARRLNESWRGEKAPRWN